MEEVAATAVAEAHRIVYCPFGVNRPMRNKFYTDHLEYVETSVEKISSNLSPSRVWVCRDCNIRISCPATCVLRRHLASKKHLLRVGLISAEDAKYQKRFSKKTENRSIDKPDDAVNFIVG
jgi:hypothetical protein